MDGEAFLGLVHDETAAAVGAGEDVGGDGVTNIFFDGITHGTGAKARVEASQDKKFEEFVAPFEIPVTAGKERQFAVEISPPRSAEGDEALVKKYYDYYTY